MTHSVSVSQIEQLRLCPRRISWRFVHHLDSVPGHGATLGSEVHSVLETYHSTGELDFIGHAKASAILAPALQFLPAPGVGRSEGAFKFQWEGISWTGRTDLVVPRTPHTAGLLLDLKTTSSRRWAKGGVELSCHPQPIIYSRYHKDEIDSCRWVYTLTRGAGEAWPVDFVALSSGPVVDDILTDAAEIVRIVTDQIQALTLPAVESSCSAYGGCSFARYCVDLGPFPGGGKEFPLINPKELLAKLRQSVDTSSGTTYEEMKGDEEKMSTKELLESLRKGNPTPPNGEISPALIVAEMAAVADAVVAGINPPEMSSPPPPLEPVVEKPKRKYTKRTATPECNPNAADPLENPPPAREFTDPNALLDSTPPPPGIVRTLYIDCRPVGLGALEVMDSAFPLSIAHDKVRTAFKVANYRYVDYAKGSGALVEFFMEEITRLCTEAEDEGLHLFLDSSTPEGQLVKSSLIAKSACVVMPCR